MIIDYLLQRVEEQNDGCGDTDDDGDHADEIQETVSHPSGNRAIRLTLHICPQGNTQGKR